MEEISILYIYVIFNIIGILGEGNLIVERGGEVTNKRIFCIGVHLTFRCTITRSTFEWIVPPFLNGAIGKGRLSVGNSETVGQFMLSASGVDATRMSTLQVTLFEGLVGERTITCREPATTTDAQSTTITVLG